MARPPTVFCEVCGRRASAKSSRRRGRSRLPRGYAWCAQCGTLTCHDCRLERGCLACVPSAVSGGDRAAAAIAPASAASTTAAATRDAPVAAPDVARPAPAAGRIASLVAWFAVHQPRRAGDAAAAPGRPPSARFASIAPAAGIAAVAVVVVASLALLRPAPPEPAGAVLGVHPEAASQQRSPAPQASSQGSSGSPSAPPGLTVDTPHLQTWSDVLGAWHGQLIARVRNEGSAPVSLDPGAATATITAGGTVVYHGPMDAAVPPDLGPGEAGYLLVGFRLPREAAQPVASVVPAIADAAPVVRLEVHDASVSREPGRVVVTGTASNSTAHEVRLGVVGAIAIGAGGEPLAGFVDEASLGRLGAGKSRPFEAADPPAPPIDPHDVDSLVVAAWARPVDE